MTENIDIAALLELPESEIIDFKARSYDLSNDKKKRDFAKDLASLANTPREGDAHIVLGVKKYPDGRYELWGINDAIDDADLQGIASSLLDPNPRFNFRTIRHSQTLLGLITIPPDQQYPVMPRKTHDNGFIEGRIYFRRGSQNALASVHELGWIWDWFRGRSITSTFSSPGDGELIPQTRALIPNLCYWVPSKRLGSHQVWSELGILKTRRRQTQQTYTLKSQTLSAITFPNMQTASTSYAPQL